MVSEARGIRKELVAEERGALLRKVQRKEALVREGVVASKVFDGGWVADKRLREAQILKIVQNAANALYVHVCLS